MYTVQVPTIRVGEHTAATFHLGFFHGELLSLFSQSSTGPSSLW